MICYNMDSKLKLKHLTLFTCFNVVTLSSCISTLCFNKDSSITDKTCMYHVDFSASDVRSKLQCANLCRDECAGVFYSRSTGQCVGCRGLYTSSSGLGTLQGSVYIQRKWHVEYVGCYQDCMGMASCPRRVMQFVGWSYDMTLDTCADLCKPSGLKYYATQNGLSCFCGDDTYNLDGPATNCDDACAGNSSQICGGWSANSVYQFVFEC